MTNSADGGFAVEACCFFGAGGCNLSDFCLPESAFNFCCVIQLSICFCTAISSLSQLFSTSCDFLDMSAATKLVSMFLAPSAMPSLSNLSSMSSNLPDTYAVDKLVSITLISLIMSSLSHLSSSSKFLDTSAFTTLVSMFLISSALYSLLSSMSPDLLDKSAATTLDPMFFSSSATATGESNMLSPSS